MKFSLIFAATSALFVSAASAHAVTALFGDEDGFGLGLMDGDAFDPATLGAGDGDGTDGRLIGTGFLAPAFEPVGGFNFAPVAGISSATLTISMLGFDSGPDPVDGPNSILLDGMAVTGLLSQFATTEDPEIVETFSVALAPSFFASLSDGSVSLAGTRISEDSGSRSFAIDFVRLDVTPVPVPASLPLLLVGGGALALLGRRKKKA
ncbi:MAG: VPLPA-CTERM sorting domain-containing protein [Pseudomonadota bacterium]